jgi:uncharacterized membrane protein
MIWYVNIQSISSVWDPQFECGIDLPPFHATQKTRSLWLLILFYIWIVFGKILDIGVMQHNVVGSWICIYKTHNSFIKPKK